MTQKSGFAIIVPVLLLVLISQCSADEHNASQPDTTRMGQAMDTITPALNYDSLKLVATSKKKAWRNELDVCPAENREAFLVQKGNQLHAFFVDSVLPCWFGTTWDFNGYTYQPKNGLIACGYFVSTPLKHMGFNLNRFKLAQQYSHSIVKTLCSDIRDLQGFDQVRSHLKSSKTGLYIVGLDNHVGFISVEDKGIYFIHSSYVEPTSVVKEDIDSSVVFQYSKRYVTGSFTGNTAVILKWLKNESIQIVP